MLPPPPSLHRVRRLAARAYKASGYLIWSDCSEQRIFVCPVTAGLAAALVSADAERIAPHHGRTA